MRKTYIVLYNIYSNNSFYPYTITTGQEIGWKHSWLN